jgi:hypothetical protein
MKRIITSLLTGSLILFLANVYGQDDFVERIEESFRVSSSRALEVLIDIDAAEVTVSKGTSEKSGRVSIRYTRDEFREKIEFNEVKNRLCVSLDKKSWGRYKRKHHDDDLIAEVQLELPYGVDILFDSKVKAGEVNLEMSGLRIREFSLTNWAGEVDVRFDEPNPIEMDFMNIDVKVGDDRFYQLGNARFKEADINGGIGEIDVDFSGELLPDSRARVDLDIGEATITLPENRGIRMRIGGGLSFLSHKDIDGSFYRRGDSYYSEDYEETSKRFYLSVTPGLGQLTIERK